MDYDSSQRIQAQLSHGESLLWSGRPRQGVIFRGTDLLSIPFSLLWAGFAVYWEYTAYSSGAPIFFLLFGGIFVVVGIYIVFGRFIVDSLTRKNTYYGVSNDRVLIVTEFPTSKTKSLSLSTMKELTFSSKPDQSGSITFGAENSMAELFTGFTWPGTGANLGPRFDTIENVKPVYDLLQKAKRDQDNVSR